MQHKEPVAALQPFPAWQKKNSTLFAIVVLTHVQVYPTAATFVVKDTLTCENVPQVYEPIPIHGKQTQVVVSY